MYVYFNKISISISISKTFDSVNFDVLLDKLENLEVRCTLLEIIKLYVSEQQQRIKIIDDECNTHTSE